MGALDEVVRRRGANYANNLTVYLGPERKERFEKVLALMHSQGINASRSAVAQAALDRFLDEIEKELAD